MIKTKKFIQTMLVILFSLALISLVACSASGSEGETNNEGQNAEDAMEQITFDGSAYSDKGDGSFFVEGTDGTRSGEATPVLIISKNAVSSSISFEADGYEQEPKTYFFIDGVLVAENNIPTKTVGLLTLTQEMLTEGTHKAEAVQFSGTDVGGEVLTYKIAEFSIQFEQVDDANSTPEGDTGSEAEGA